MTQPRQHTHRTWMIAPAALVGLAILYLATRQHIFTIDSLYYLADTESGSWPRLLHPHHLILQPVLRGWLRLWQWFAWPGCAVVPLQAFNVMVTVGALALVWRLMLHVTSDRTIAAVAALVFAFSYVNWYYATQAEGVPLFTFCGAVGLWWGARLPQRRVGNPPGYRSAFGLAAAIAGAVLIHQSLVLWAPLLAWMLAREARPGRRLRLGLLCATSAGVIVLAVYVIACARVNGRCDPSVLWHWTTGYGQEFADRCGSFRALLSTRIPRGLGSAILTGAPLKPYAYEGRGADWPLMLRLVPYGIVAAVITGGLAGLSRAWRAREAAGGRTVVNVLALTLVGALFASWWEPANRKFWVAVLPGSIAVVAVGWTGWRQWTGPRLAIAGAVLVAMTALFNLGAGILPRHRVCDERQPLVTFVVRHTDADDAVVLREDRVWLCLTYFRPERVVHGLPGPGSHRDDAEHSVFRAAISDARRALVSGATLYVAASQWDAVHGALRPDLGPLPTPTEALRFVDADLPGREQILLEVRLPRSRP